MNNNIEKRAIDPMERLRRFLIVKVCNIYFRTKDFCERNTSLPEKMDWTDEECINEYQRNPLAHNICNYFIEELLSNCKVVILDKPKSEIKYQDYNFEYSQHKLNEWMKDFKNGPPKTIYKQEEEEQL